MTAALEGGEWSAAHPGCTLPPENTRYPLYRRLGGPHGQSGWAENLVPTGDLIPDSPARSQLLHYIYLYIKNKWTVWNVFFLTSFLVLKMSPSTFFARFCLLLLKYLSFTVAGNFTLEISNFVLVAITKFWLMRRRGHALILKGPGSGKEKHCKYFTVNVYHHLCRRWQYNLFEHFSTYNT